MTMIERSDIERRFFMVRSEPSPASPFGFSILLPRDARQHQPEQQAGSAFVPLACFRGQSERAFEIRVSALPLFHDIDVGDFIENSALATGHRIIQRRDWKDSKGCCAEIFAEFEEKGVQWVRRVRAVKDGNLVYSIDGAAPKAHFAKVEHDCALALASFRLNQPSSRYCAENLTLASTVEPLPVRFEHPESWVAKWSGPDAHRVECELSLPGKATIMVQGMTRQEAGDSISVIRRFASDLKKKGFHLAGAPIAPAPSTKGVSRSLVWATQGRKSGRAIMAGAHVIEADAAVALLGATAPSREEDPWSWARTKRAFTLLLESFEFV